MKFYNYLESDECEIWIAPGRLPFEPKDPNKIYHLEKILKKDWYGNWIVWDNPDLYDENFDLKNQKIGFNIKNGLKKGFK